MKNILISNSKLVETDGVITLKNMNTTLGLVRFNDKGEVEYIFVNPLFRKIGIAKKLLRLVRDKTRKKLKLQKPLSPLGLKLLNFVKSCK